MSKSKTGSAKSAKPVVKAKKTSKTIADLAMTKKTTKKKK